MLQFTTIARASDGLVLGADTETNAAAADLEKTKATAKNILKRLSGQGSALPEALTIDSSSSSFHILNEGGVLFLTMCDPSSPSAIAYAYLEAVAKEFLHQHGQQVDAAKRPYYFIKFDVTLQRLKKQFQSAAQYGGAANQATSRISSSPPERRTFRDVMGYGDAPRRANTTAEGAGRTDLTVAIAAASVAVLLLVLLVATFLLS